MLLRVGAGSDSAAQPRQEDNMQNGTNPARAYALVFGAVLVVAGIIGFFYSSEFGSPGEVDGVFGILDVNGWHNVVHIATGALGLLAFAGGAYAARTYALGLGAVYILVAIWGFIVGDGDTILGFLPVNTEDNVLHLLIGITGRGAARDHRPARLARHPQGHACAYDRDGPPDRDGRRDGAVCAHLAGAAAG